MTLEQVTLPSNSAMEPTSLNACGFGERGWAGASSPSC
jgi:hypothetical protein